MAKPETIDISKLLPGPIRHDSLPQELLDRIRAVHELVGPFLNLNLEKFEIGFMRDANPEREVAVWCCIVNAWLKYHEQFTQDELLPEAEEQKLLGALIQISSGMDDPADFSVPPEIGVRLITCYRGNQ